MIIDGGQIAAGRSLIGWKQHELAAAAGVHPNIVCKWERRGPLDRANMVQHTVLDKLESALRKGGVAMIEKPAPGVLKVTASLP